MFRRSPPVVLAFFCAAGPSIALTASCSVPEDVSETSRSASALTGALAEKDIAVVFRAEDLEAPAASTRLPGGDTLLASATYQTVADAYARTSVGAAFTEESRYDDWRVVSFRIAPCSPLTPAPRAEWASLCWPEVRIVFQPILRNVRIHERTSLAYADDRAIHALFDAPAESALAPAVATRARSLVAQVRAASKAWRGASFSPLSASELVEFESARDAVSRALGERALSLRDPRTPSSAFNGHGVRPESAGGGQGARDFASRVKSLFADYTRPSSLRALTAFSLPEGREPAQFDEWVFLSFETNGGALVRQRITMRSVIDGRSLVDLGIAPRGSQTRDDDTLYSDDLDARTQAEIAERAMLGPADIARLTPKLRDPSTTLVPNTTCASCHKMNPLRFDFHNLGYLEDRDLTVSPRVVSDVLADLAWANR